MEENKELQWVERQINHPGERHPVGLLFGGEVQLWVLGAAPEPEGFRGDPTRRVSLKSHSGGKDHGIINEWKVYPDTDAAKEAAQQYVYDNWDDLCAMREEGEQ